MGTFGLFLVLAYVSSKCYTHMVVLMAKVYITSAPDLSYILTSLQKLIIRWLRLQLILLRLIQEVGLPSERGDLCTPSTSPTN